MLRTLIAVLFATSVASKLIFQDNFDTKLDFTKWAHEITIGGGGNWEFEWYVNNRTNSFVDNGVLYLQPTLTEDMMDVGYMRTAS